jgi:hypothetical protein
LGEAVVVGSIAARCLLELDERVDAAVARLRGTSVKRVLADLSLSRNPKGGSLLEQVDEVQARVGLGDPAVLSAVPVGEVLWYFHSSKRACLA